jgi:hypothetical protein
MVMRELHEGPSKGHFAIQIMHRKILDISGQQCIKMCMITINLLMHVKKHEDLQFKVLQSWSQVFKKNHL